MKNKRLVFLGIEKPGQMVFQQYKIIVNVKLYFLPFVTYPGHCPDSDIHIIFKIRALHEHFLYVPIVLQVTFIFVEVNEAAF